MPLVSWNVKKADEDTERIQLNRILADIQTVIDSLPPSSGGTVTSVAATTPLGLTVAGSPITGSGTLMFTYTAGYQGYTSTEATKLAGVATGATANTGTVTSVAVAAATGITWTGSPITTSGTLTPTLSVNLQAWSGITTASKEPAITAGTTAQMWRGDKTFTNSIVGDVFFGAAGSVRVGNGFSGVGTNTAVGNLAMAVANTGTQQTAVGSSALRLATTGSNNTAIGTSAMVRNEGNNNVAVGNNTLSAGNGTPGTNYTGSGTVAIGASACSNATTGGSNVGVGASALTTNLTGASNTAIGNNALLLCTVSNNTVVGAFAGDAITTGTPNVAVGVNALGANQTGANNVAVGPSALLLATGSSNTAVGALAGDAITTGASNVAVGENSLGANQNGSFNIAIGASAGLLLATGNDNIFIGYQAGDAATAGSSQVAIGSGALGAYSTTGNNFNLALGSSSLNALISGQFNTGIGTQSGSLQQSNSRCTYVGFRAGTTATPANANVSGGNNTYVGYDSGPGTSTQLTNATGLGCDCVVTTSSTVVLGRAASDFTVIGATGNSGGGCKLQVTGHVGVLGAGNGLRVAEGSNAKQGVATLVAGTVTVANTSVTANSRIFLTIQDPLGGTVGTPYVSARTAATSFTITSTSGADVSLVAYEIFEPGV